jgi:pyridoxal 5'-phosphate synthase pdxT subunit
MRVGILALQGGYQAHAQALAPWNISIAYIRDTADLLDTDGLIIPGGESSVLINLLQKNGLWNALMDYKKPIFGTCAGAILLAKEVLAPAQASLGRINMIIERNAYGRQLASQVQTGNCLLSQSEIEMVFIRAPKISRVAKQVKILAEYHQQPVAVQEGNCIAATFHPELSQMNTLHRYFIQHIN